MLEAKSGDDALNACIADVVIQRKNDINVLFRTD